MKLIQTEQVRLFASVAMLQLAMQQRKSAAALLAVVVLQVGVTGKFTLVVSPAWMAINSLSLSSKHCSHNRSSQARSLTHLFIFLHFQHFL
jgi:hypothetical protein